MKTKIFIGLIFFMAIDNRSITKQYIVCDQNSDSHNGFGDSNGDGFCTAGETCTRPKY